jgi:molybdate transport system ATP-binding protein
VAEPALFADFKLPVPGFVLTMHIEAGPELLVVFGPSGAGKSLTLRALAGLIRPASGRISLHDHLLFDSGRGINVPPQARGIGYVPQNYALFPHLTIAGNIGYGLKGLSAGERSRRVSELASLMGLDDLADRFPGEISGGQGQRVALARALARQPSLLLMDEPFAALEEALRGRLRQELKRVQQAFHMPVILVTHSLPEAYSLADRLVVTEGGRVAQTGDRDQVFRHPATPTIGRLMGMTNILPAEVVQLSAAGGRVLWAGRQLILDAENLPDPGARLMLGVRPEEIMFVRSDRRPAAVPPANMFEGLLAEDQAQGFDHLLTVVLQQPGLPPATLSVRVAHPIFLKLGLQLGRTCSLSLPPRAFHAFPAVP